MNTNWFQFSETHVRYHWLDPNYSGSGYQQIHLDGKRVSDSRLNASSDSACVQSEPLDYTGTLTNNL